MSHDGDGEGDGGGGRRHQGEATCKMLMVMMHRLSPSTTIYDACSPSLSVRRVGPWL